LKTGIWGQKRPAEYWPSAGETFGSVQRLAELRGLLRKMVR
jgi:hypothetical protein